LLARIEATTGVLKKISGTLHISSHRRDADSVLSAEIQVSQNFLEIVDPWELSSKLLDTSPKIGDPRLVGAFPVEPSSNSAQEVGC